MIDIEKNKEINKKLSELYVEYSQDFLSVYTDAFEDSEPPCRINEFGIIDEERFDADNGVLVIAKETNKWHNWEFERNIFFRDWMSDITKTGLADRGHITKHPIMWYNMGRWLKAIENPSANIDDIAWLKSEAISQLGTMAFTNINKVRGGSSSRNQYAKVAYSEIVGTVLREEIEIIQPKIIMCCGTWRVFNYHLNCEVLEKAGCKVLCMPHPAARKGSKEMIEDLIKQLEENK